MQTREDTHRAAPVEHGARRAAHNVERVQPQTRMSRICSRLPGGHRAAGFQPRLCPLRIASGAGSPRWYIRRRKKTPYMPFLAVTTMPLEGLAAASAFHGEPTLIVAPNQVVLLSTRAAVEAFFDRFAASPKRNEYSHSTLIGRCIKLLTSTTALCGGVAIRMKVDGTEMQRSGFTYLLQKTRSMANSRNHCRRCRQADQCRLRREVSCTSPVSETARISAPGQDAKYSRLALVRPERLGICLDCSRKLHA
jgi:hypothetical protein